VTAPEPWLGVSTARCLKDSEHHLTVVSVVLGFGFCGWASAEAVHEPAGVVPVHPGGGDLFEVGEGRSGPVRTVSRRGCIRSCTA